MPERELADGGCACQRCHREMEDCSFCGEPDCPAPMCYQDILAALGLQVAQPHAHGG